MSSPADDRQANPYHSPQTAPTDDEVAQATKPYFPTHFTHITVNGCNLLGLGNIFGFIGITALAIAAIAADARALKIVVLALAFCGCCVFDLVLRSRSGSGHWLIRLISPDAGGALFFIPVWIVYPAVIVIGSIMLLTRN